MKAAAIFLTLVATTYAGCTRERIMRPGPGITFQGGRLLYNGDLFSGIVVETFTQIGTTRETEYEDGLMDGDQKEFFVNRKLAAHLQFTRGKKTGVHRGWFENGRRRFQYEYADGAYDGEAWEWYDTGELSQYARFEHGKSLGKKVWRRDGQIYQNWVFPKTGQIAGVPGTKLCYQVRDGKR